MEHRNEKKQFRIYFLVIILVLSFALGMFFEKRSAAWGITKGTKSQAAFGELSVNDLEFLDNIWKVLEDKYAGELPGKDEAVQGAARGLVGSLDDPYTVFWDQEESRDFLEEMQGSFEGIGAEIGVRDQILTVVSPLDDMPAQRAGIMAGDKILQIDDELANDMTLDEAVKKIRGPKGSKVKLTIFRENNGGGDPIEIEVTRDKIDIKSVKWEDKGDGQVYVRISGFLKDTDKEFERAAGEIRKTDAQAIILDLRNNPGGYLTTAIELAGYFLPRGSLVVKEEYEKGLSYKNKEHETSGKGILKDYPVVILINKGTASSAEILAGAIRDNKGAKLIGEQTFGKGSVQEMVDLEQGSSLKITVAKWFTPNGQSIDKQGLSPDIEQKLTSEDIKQGRDSQLDRAKEILSGGKNN
ncbi:MAG: S41 family peptidase [Patescibacteria group bacterium]|nr:S41 family peptidase [Patescibacteria group bacterium]